jgi:hypothetical protein
MCHFTVALILENLMGNFLLGTIFGIVIGTVGFSEIAPMLDRGIEYIQYGSREYVNRR